MGAMFQFFCPRCGFTSHELYPGVGKEETLICYCQNCHAVFQRTADAKAHKLTDRCPDCGSRRLDIKLDYEDICCPECGTEMEDEVTALTI